MLKDAMTGNHLCNGMPVALYKGANTFLSAQHQANKPLRPKCEEVSNNKVREQLLNPKRYFSL